ncbi:hypothetical protein Dda_6949 [Drechslerella dactyloides]|uniref:Uncharacterized protein n=1 Tax=Drechslerella dactyloides TaxID=74499 RepID=A0AAD6NH73_DREDA|nr:hypothetical protein Dda_6949 [Drechslerella dactyloides]
MRPKSSPCSGGGTIISFSVGNRLPYSVPLLDLPGKVHQVDIDLRDGDHTIASPEFELGTFKLNGQKTIMGRLRFGYSYDSKNQVITVCGTNYASAGSMTLITRPKGTDQLAFEYSASGFAADEAAPHQDWNYNTQLMPGVAKFFREIARQANDAFIAALVEAQIYMVRVRSNLSDLQIDDYLNLCVVTSADGQFLGPYDPTAEYEEGVKINPLDSVYYGTTVVPAGTFFANVIGSDGDPKVRGLSWIELWRQMVNGGQQPVACTSYNFNGFACGPVDRGGHIIPGTVARPIPNGSDVYIFPICAAHNNNDNVYMSAITYQTAVWLKNYMGR